MDNVYTIRDITEGNSCVEICKVFKTFQSALKYIQDSYPKCLSVNAFAPPITGELYAWGVDDGENYFVIHECLVIE